MAERKVKQPKVEKVKLHKTSARRFKERIDESLELIAPAEFEVRRGDKILALMIKAQDGWRVCLPTEDSRIGIAISPVDLNAFRQVKAWALAHFAAL